MGASACATRIQHMPLLRLIVLTFYTSLSNASVNRLLYSKES